MNPFKIFTETEIEEIQKIEELENREYTKEELIRLQNKVAENIISDSKRADAHEERRLYNYIDKIGGALRGAC